MSRSSGNESADISLLLFSLSEEELGRLLSMRYRIPARLDEDMVDWQKETWARVYYGGRVHGSSSYASPGPSQQVMNQQLPSCLLALSGGGLGTTTIDKKAGVDPG